ncbi:GntR family transcriptional regulator [Ramlibacter sp.]|uniref:GntR family transcriptional regulator n=1 Tax=Ramlibacter sp. TaxID=1917967 RepID=UPI002FC72BD6
MPTRQMAARKPPVAQDGESSGTLTEQVYTRLESMIVTLELPPGTLLSELSISGKFGVSRTPVGEALQRLAREGLVTVLPRRGFVVTEISATDQIRLLELRREIARFVARSGAERATPGEREALREVSNNFLKAAKARDEAGVTAADKRFHDLFADCAHNNFAAMAMEPLDSLSRRFSHAHRMMRDGAMKSAQLHAAIALAMADGDAKRAVEASDKLADYLEEFVRSTLDRPPALTRQSGRR